LLEAELDRVLPEALPAEIQAVLPDVASSPAAANTLSCALAETTLPWDTVLLVFLELARLVPDLIKYFIVV